MSELFCAANSQTALTGRVRLLDEWRPFCAGDVRRRGETKAGFNQPVSKGKVSLGAGELDAQPVRRHQACAQSGAGHFWFWPPQQIGLWSLIKRPSQTSPQRIG